MRPVRLPAPAADSREPVHRADGPVANLDDPPLSGGSGSPSSPDPDRYVRVSPATWQVCQAGHRVARSKDVVGPNAAWLCRSVPTAVVGGRGPRPVCDKGRCWSSLTAPDSYGADTADLGRRLPLVAADIPELTTAVTSRLQSQPPDGSVGPESYCWRRACRPTLHDFSATESGIYRTLSHRASAGC